jgi:hypothetical protein
MGRNHIANRVVLKRSEFPGEFVVLRLLVKCSAASVSSSARALLNRPAIEPFLISLASSVLNSAVVIFGPRSVERMARVVTG